MSVDWLDDHPEQVEYWMQLEETKMFFAALKDMKDEWVKTLRVAEKIEDVFRAQGSLDGLDSVIDLPDSVRRLNEDRKTGKRR